MLHRACKLLYIFFAPWKQPVQVKAAYIETTVITKTTSLYEGPRHPRALNLDLGRDNHDDGVPSPDPTNDNTQGDVNEDDIEIHYFA